MRMCIVCSGAVTEKNAERVGVASGAAYRHHDPPGCPPEAQAVMYTNVEEWRRFRDELLDWRLMVIRSMNVMVRQLERGQVPSKEDMASGVHALTCIIELLL